MNVAICAIAKCENLYINEWAEYHLNLGFDHIYVYDNNEIDGEKISDVLSDDRITVINYRGKHQSSCETQVKAYNECYNGYGNKYDWIMFIDIDEFLTLEKFGNIKDFLSQRCFADAKAVRFHWKCYSDSGKLKYEEGSVISRFTELCENGEVNKYYKQIYRTKLPKFRMMNVHYCDFIGGIYYPDGSSARYIMQTTDKNVNYVCGYIRHYVTKTLEEFVDIKWKRRGNGSSKTRLNKEFYFKYNKKTEEKSRYFDEYFNKVSNGVQPIGNGNTQYNTITQKPLKPKIMPYQQEPPIKNQTQSLGNVDYRTPQERAVCPGARKTSNPAIKHGLPQKSVQNDLSVSEYPFGVSVCISAWKTAEYIEECLDSVAAQTWFKDHDNYEILLGIDGCDETLAKVKEIMHKYKNLKVMMMDKNVGTYVTCNTIMKEARYEWLLRFDSDDTMPNDMIAKIFANDLKNIDLVRYQYHNFGIRQGNGGLANGSHLVKNKVFNHFGGYRNWKISADYDFVYRICNKIHYLELRNIYYNRRTHNNSLMNTNGYEMGSKLRNELNDFVEKKSRQNSIIECEITDYTEIYNNIPKIIVSFTTWLKRQESAAKMLEHFKKQTLKPDKIYCYLSSDEYNGENIPYCLQKFIDEEYLVIKWVKENTYCHKRHEIFKEHFYDYVFVIDDDILYDNNYIMDMFNAALNHPKNVICYTGCRYEYNEKRMNMTVTENPSVKNSFLGGVCCFPPTMFPLDDYFNNIDIRNEIAKKCDSSYIHVILLKNNISVFLVNDRKNKWFTTIDGTQDVGVWTENKKIVRDNINYMENIVRLLVKKINIEDKFNKIYPNFI